MTGPLSLEGAEVCILGGTGSLGQRLFRRILTGESGQPTSITILSRDEAKQHYMRLEFLNAASATDDIIYRESVQRVRFAIGDVRSYEDVRRAADRADVIFHAAAYKQVPTCEYFAGAAVDTNVYGALNLVRALREGTRRTRAVVGISTDKACKPVNVMGMTKALQERILVQGSLEAPWVRFVNVRYGNVMASRGSAIPLFVSRVRQGAQVPITDERMTRFLMTLDQSVDLIFAALEAGMTGETWLPMVPSARVVDIARAVAGDPKWPVAITGIRPGEKIHEILVSEEETPRTVLAGSYLVILPILPELRTARGSTGPLPFTGEYSSEQGTLAYEELCRLLTRHELTAQTAPAGAEFYK
jgi:UDP-glucose 4-epimerase